MSFLLLLLAAFYASPTSATSTTPTPTPYLYTPTDSWITDIWTLYSYPLNPTHLTTSIWVYAAESRAAPPTTTTTSGYFARVLAVHDNRTTLAFKPDMLPPTHISDTDIDATVTVGPTYYGRRTSVPYHSDRINSDLEAARLDCTKTGAAGEMQEAGARCTRSAGAVMAEWELCPDARYRPESRTTTVPASVAAKGPQYCGEPSGVGAEVTVFDAPGGMFVKRLITITEGEEILTGGTPASKTSSGAKETGGASGNGGRARVPVQTAGPVVVGLGVAAALMV